MKNKEKAICIGSGCKENNNGCGIVEVELEQPCKICPKCGGSVLFKKNFS